jgi:hypothetical protein
VIDGARFHFLCDNFSREFGQRSFIHDIEEIGESPENAFLLRAQAREFALSQRPRGEIGSMFGQSEAKSRKMRERPTAFGRIINQRVQF